MTVRHSTDQDREVYGFDDDGYYPVDVFVSLPDGSGFVSPDGIGRYFYDSEEEAEEEHGEPLKSRPADEVWDGNVPYEEED